MTLETVMDANNNPVAKWDAVVITQNIKVKWSSDIKKWTKFKVSGIYDEENVEGRVDGTMMVIKTMYIKADKKKKK